jgi:hypothetical protein
MSFLINSTSSILSNISDLAINIYQNYPIAITVPIGLFLGAGIGCIANNIRQTNRHVSVLQQDLLVSQRERDAFKNMHAGTLESIRSLGEGNQRLENKIKNENINYRYQNEADLEKIKVLSKENDFLNQRLKEAECNVLDLTRQIDENLVKLKKLEIEHRSLYELSIKKNVNQLKNAIVVEEEIKTLKTKIQNLSQNLQTELNEKTQLQAEIEKNKEELKECKSAFDLLLKEQISNLEIEKRLVEKIKTLTATNENFSEDFQEALNELKELKAITVTLKDELTSKDGVLDHLEALLVLEKAQTKNTLDNINPNPFLIDDVKHLTEQVKFTRNNASQLIRQYEQEIARLMQKLSNQEVVIQSQLSEAQKETGLEHPEDRASYQKLQQRYNELEIINSENATIALRSEAKIMDLSRRVEDLVSTIKQKDTKIEALQKEMNRNDLSKKMSNQKLTIDRLENEVENLKGTLKRKELETDAFFSDWDQTRNEELRLQEQRDSKQEAIVQKLANQLQVLQKQYNEQGVNAEVAIQLLKEQLAEATSNSLS